MLMQVWPKQHPGNQVVDNDQKYWTDNFRQPMVEYTGVVDLCYRDIVKAGTFAAHGLTEYIDYEHCAGNSTNYIDFIYEALLCFFVESKDVFAFIDKTAVKDDPRSSVLLACIRGYACLNFAQRRNFFDKNSMIDQVGGELIFRWHSHCDYIRGEADETRRMRFIYITVAEFLHMGALLRPELPYRQIGAVSIPVHIPEVPFLHYSE